MDDYRTRRGQPRHRAAQGHREGHLHDRHPRGARLRAPVRAHRPQAGARRDLRHPGLLRLGARAAPASPSSTATATSGCGSWPDTRSPSRPRPSTSTRRSTRPAVAAANGSAATRTTRRRCASWSSSSRSRCATSSTCSSDREPIPVERADAGVGLHSYPIVISSMSFGSQGETAYRAYAEAAKRANIIAMNGEGGEIQDMYGKYPLWRGQQVASGRFGVTSEMLNSSFLVEIKIGQGAKPGEGGHLPARKVTEKVAAGPQRHRRHRPDLALEQPRPLLDRGPGGADRRAEDGQPRRARVGQGAGGAEHRHDRRGHRQGGRRHHHAVGLRGRHGRRALARAAPRGPARRTSARARCTWR